VSDFTTEPQEVKIKELSDYQELLKVKPWEQLVVDVDVQARGGGASARLVLTLLDFEVAKD
jgi:hypothetical protein